MDELWASAKKTKTISKSYIHEILKKFGKYPEDEEAKRGKPNGFQKPPDPGKCFCIDTGTCFIGDKTQIHFQPIYDEFNSVLVAGMSSDHRLSLKALEELCRLCPDGGF